MPGVRSWRGWVRWRSSGALPPRPLQPPVREEAALLVQSFSHGTLFPTQGDVEGVPYTVILWDAADRGFFFAD